MVVCLQPAGPGGIATVTVVTGTQSSNSSSFTYDAPVVSSISPAVAPAAGGSTITIMGSNFGPLGGPVTVTIGTKTCTNPTHNHTVLLCSTPSGTGLFKAVSVTVSSLTSNQTVYMNYSGPVLSSISPTVGPAAGGVSFVISGLNFGTYDKGNITIGGVPCPVTQLALYQDNTVACQLPAGVGTALPVLIVVDGQQSGSLNFSYAAPVISTMTPTNGPTSGVRLTLQGSGFSGDPYVATVDAPLRRAWPCR